MARRRRAPYPGLARAQSGPETVESVTHVSDASEAPDTAQALPIETHSVTDTHDASVHETLLETVSVEALQSHDGAVMDVAAEAAPEPEEAGTAAVPVLAIDASPVSVVNDSAPAVVDPVADQSASHVTPTLPVPAVRRTLALEALGELSETNATVVGFLRSEGAATLAHWRSLAGAKSPADAVRLQVDEMQRAADASITCLSTLARRAGRFAGLLNRD